jgi:hypothetical protein
MTFYLNLRISVFFHIQNRILGVTNPTPLKIISSSRFVRKGYRRFFLTFCFQLVLMLPKVSLH